MKVNKVMIVDDSESVRKQVQDALVPVGYEVLEAKDGVDGFEKITGENELDLVICDVNMPRMTGLQLLAEVRRRGMALPFLMLTTEGNPVLIKRAKEMGAQGWLVKPLRPSLLVAAVNKFLPPQRGERRP